MVTKTENKQTEECADDHYKHRRELLAFDFDERDWHDDTKERKAEPVGGEVADELIV